MKPLLVLGTLLFAAISAHAQLAVAIATGDIDKTINVPAGKAIQVLDFRNDDSNFDSRGASYLIFSEPNLVTSIPVMASLPLSAQDSRKPLCLPGPCSISFHAPQDANNAFLATVLNYKIIDLSGEAAGPQLPANSVVIPADATGPVQIILESSTDMITWTVAQPGSYGASTTKRFFRVRAVQSAQ